MKMSKGRTWMYGAAIAALVAGFAELATGEPKLPPSDAGSVLDLAPGERWPPGAVGSYVSGGAGYVAGPDLVRFYSAKHWDHCERVIGLLISDGGVLSPSIIARAFEGIAWKPGTPGAVSVCFNADGGR